MWSLIVKHGTCLLKYSRRLYQAIVITRMRVYVDIGKPANIQSRLLLAVIKEDNKCALSTCKQSNGIINVGTLKQILLQKQKPVGLHLINIQTK